MKKTLLSLILLAAIHLAGMAQTAKSSASEAFNSGDNLLNVGIGLGSPFFGSGYSSSIPVNPTVTYEKGVTDAISVGGTVSYASSKYDFSGFGSAYSFTENAVYVGVRGSYHFAKALQLSNKFDLYGGASAGYVIVSVSDNQGDVGSAASAVGYGLFAGGKYYFAPKIGIYAEVGYESLSYLNVGLAFKF
jgi:hypothetical protein